MRIALVAALLSAVLAAPVLAAPPAFEAKPHTGTTAIEPGVKPKADDRFDLDAAPNLSQLTKIPPALSAKDFDSLTPEERQARCRVRTILNCPMPPVKPRGEPKLYLLSPQLQPVPRPAE